MIYNSQESLDIPNVDLLTFLFGAEPGHFYLGTFAVC